MRSADAALSALETPDEGMVEAGLTVFMRGGNLGPTYTAMIRSIREATP